MIDRITKEINFRRAVISTVFSNERPDWGAPISNPMTEKQIIEWFRITFVRRVFQPRCMGLRIIDCKSIPIDNNYTFVKKRLSDIVIICDISTRNDNYIYEYVYDAKTLEIINKIY